MGLSGGFASARISAVLTATDYLMPRVAANAASGRMMTEAAANRTFVRLLETNVWNLDVMDRPANLRPPSERSQDSVSLDSAGAGWVSSARVRLLHANVRLQCARRGTSSDAINQEDLVATLCAFAIVPLWSLSVSRTALLLGWVVALKRGASSVWASSCPSRSGRTTSPCGATSASTWAAIQRCCAARFATQAPPSASVSGSAASRRGPAHSLLASLVGGVPPLHGRHASASLGCAAAVARRRGAGRRKDGPSAAAALRHVQPATVGHELRGELR
jgi:hypothetical protein